MTDKHIPASKLLALQRYESHELEDIRKGKFIDCDDLHALIDAEPESVEPVAVIALKNAELNNRACVLEDLLSSAYAIANRNGSDTHWPRFASQLHINGISPITAKTFKVLPSDVDYFTAPPADNLIAEKQATIDRLTEQLGHAIEENAKLISETCPYVHIRVDCSEYEKDLKIRNKLIELGWQPPPENKFNNE